MANIPAVDEKFQAALIRQLAELARATALPKIPSRTLQKGLNIFVRDSSTAYVQIPHYWALYVHDGRGPFGPVKSTFLVWFRNRRNDPRIRNGITPVRASDIPRLTEGQFKFWLRQNAIARASGFPEPMIVRKRVFKRVLPSLFFDNSAGMAGFVDRANNVGNEVVNFHIFNRLKDVGAFSEFKDSVTIHI